MDNFKKYLQENKDRLDLEIPDSRIWDTIAQKTFPEEKAVVRSFSWKWMVAAACLVLVFGISYWFFDSKENGKKTPILANNTSVNSTHTTPTIISSDTNKIESKTEKEPQDNSNKRGNISYVAQTKRSPKEVSKSPRPFVSQAFKIEDVQMTGFSKMVNYQKTFINTMPIYGENASYFNAFKIQLNQMDDDEKSIRKEIKDHGLNPDQLDLLINIYQQKINLLKQLNQEINRINKSYYQNHYKSDSIIVSKPHFLNI